MNYLIALIAFFSAVSFALPLKQHSNPRIKFVVFKTGQETEEQLAMLPKVNAFAQLYGSLAVQEEVLAAGTYTSGQGEKLHNSWIKIERTLAAMKGDEQADWVLVFELSSLPTDGTGAIDFGALIVANPGTSVFLKRSGLSFSMAMYRNQPAIQQVLSDLWLKRSASSSVGSAFTSHTFWNPSLLTQIKFL